MAPIRRPFCAICIEGHVGLRPRILEDGGPVFIICEACDERDPPSPFPAVVTRPPPATRGGGWVKKRYHPIDEIRSGLIFRILEIVKHLGWANSSEIAELMCIPGSGEDWKARNTFSVSLSRMFRDGFLVRRQTTGTRGKKGWDEYAITELGLARLENDIRCTFEARPTIAV